jgi:hypothetical protein
MQATYIIYPNLGFGFLKFIVSFLQSTFNIHLGFKVFMVSPSPINNIYVALKICQRGFWCLLENEILKLAIQVQVAFWKPHN